MLGVGVGVGVGIGVGVGAGICLEPEPQISKMGAPATLNLRLKFILRGDTADAE